MMSLLSHLPLQHHVSTLVAHIAALPAVLLGPLKAVNYLFIHGVMAFTLGALWHWKAHWSVSLAFGVVARLGGLVTYWIITCWILNEDIFSLLLANVLSLLVTHLAPLPATIVLSPGCYLQGGA